VSSNAIIRRLEALERAIIARPPTLIFVWTKSLAERIGPLVPQGRNIRLVCWKMEDADGSFEAELRETNRQEAERLDALLRGEFADRYPGVTPDGLSLTEMALGQGVHGFRHRSD
jgi:hypothetical protein